MATRTIKVPKIVNGVTTGTQDVQIEDYGNTSWGPKDKHRLVNTRQPRVDGPFKTTGKALYTHDVRVPGMLHGRLLTSPYAHARITAIDTTAAEKIDGVKVVMQVVNPGSEILFEGQPVVALAARTPEIAEDAARAVVVQYDKLPHTVTAEDALKPGAPQVVPTRGGGFGGFGGGGGGGGPRGGPGGGGPGGAPGGGSGQRGPGAKMDAGGGEVFAAFGGGGGGAAGGGPGGPGGPGGGGPGAFGGPGGGGGGFGGGRGGGGAGFGRGNSQGTPEQVEEALKTCDAIIEADYKTPRLHHCCLETHSAVADFRGGDSATVYVSTQGTTSIMGDAQRELGVPVTAVVQNMGGGFGSKFGVGLAGTWACRLAKQTGVPVKLVLTREQEFLAAGNGPGSWQKFRAGATKDGILTAMNVTQYSLVGLGGGAVANQPYQYTCKTVYRQAVSVNTNEDSSVPLRAPGHPQACFAMESLMDELAYKLGMDPVEFRKKNAGDPAWHRQLDTGAKAIGWENRNMTPGKLKGPLVRGMGCAIGAWPGAAQPNQCTVTVTIAQDGTVKVYSATQDLGTGTRTYVRSIVAEELGLGMDQVQEEIGETGSLYGNANASGGSATSASLSPAVKDAAYNARMAIQKAIAPVLGADEGGIWLNDGQVIGNGKSITWKEACSALPQAGIQARGQFQAALAGRGAHGASFAEVEVDIETGFVHVTKMCHVQDGGLILNRLAAESQINGGMIQSIGMALYEGRVMDVELGAMVNPAFNDYKFAGTMEIPELIPIIDDGDERNVVMGIAEPANIPGCGAIANAVYNACGVRVRETPITPDKILMGLQELRRNA